MRRSESMRLSEGAQPLLDLRSVDDIFDSGFDVNTGIATAATAAILKESDLTPICDYAGSLALGTFAVNVSAQNHFF